MKILLTGATGFIGSALAQALQARGHTVVPVSRSTPHGLKADFARVPTRDWWLPHLAGVDCVVNAVGIITESQGRSFRALHTDAPVELFHAAAAAGVPHVVQVSALGAVTDAPSRYHRTKAAADDVLRSLPVASTIVQPSLVYGARGASAALFNRMAVAPLLPFPGGGGMLVQPVHVDDLVEALVALVEQGPHGGSRTLVASGPQPLTMRAYLQRLRQAMGLRSKLRVLPVPAWLFRAAAAVAGRLPGSVLDRETAGMLLRGNAATDPGFAAVLAHPPRDAADFIAPGEREWLRRAAVLDLWLPVLRLAIACVWFWTAAVSFGLYPVQDSYALLARVGLQGAAAAVALYGAALLDLALGALTLAAPRRWRPWVWGAQLLLIAGYTALITLFLPEYWLHPYGPLTKNLPMIAAIALLWALEPPHRR